MDSNLSIIRVAPTVSKNLKDVGTDLVASLKLFDQFSRTAEEIAEWWTCLKDGFASGSSALPHLESKPGETDEQFVLWSNMKENLWEYYTIVCTFSLLQAI